MSQPPNIPDGYIDLPPGKIASVVTYLEMRTPSADREAPPSDFTLRRVATPDLDWYRRLYREIGEPWLWFSRLRMSDDELRAILNDSAVDVFALAQHGSDIGIAEYDARRMPDIELSFFGVVPTFIGKGAGRALLDQSLRHVWNRQPQRVWLHTCTLDHPAALAFYRRAGFVSYRRAIEVADDPRLTGAIPRSTAPDIPIL